MNTTLKETYLKDYPSRAANEVKGLAGIAKGLAALDKNAEG